MMAPAENTAMDEMEKEARVMKRRLQHMLNQFMDNDVDEISVDQVQGWITQGEEMSATWHIGILVDDHRDELRERKAVWEAEITRVSC